MVRRFAVRDSGTCIQSGANITDKISAGTLGDSTIGATYSLGFWAGVRSDGNTTEARIFDKGVDHIKLVAGNEARVTHDAGNVDSASNYIIYDGIWRHYEITYDGTNCRFYRDAALFSTGALATAPSSETEFSLLNRGSGSRAFDGYMDDFILYKNKVLTLAEIEGIYYDNIVPSGSLIHYKFDEGSGTTAIDSSGNYNGTITDATYSTNVKFKPRTSV